MKYLIPKNSTGVILAVFIQDSSSSTGAGLASLDENSTITGGYLKRDSTGVQLDVDENVTTEGTYEAPSAAGKARIGTPANQINGVYELHLHNDLWNAKDWISISLGGAANMAPLLLEIQLTDDIVISTAVHADGIVADTVFRLVAGSSDDDAYNNMIVTLGDISGKESGSQIIQVRLSWLLLMLMQHSRLLLVTLLLFGLMHTSILQIQPRLMLFETLYLTPLLRILLIRVQLARRYITQARADNDY